MSVLIPYIDEPHPVTGVTNAKLGIWLFLASEVMLFGALFFDLHYYERRIGQNGRTGGEVLKCAAGNTEHGCF